MEPTHKGLCDQMPTGAAGAECAGAMHHRGGGVTWHGTAPTSWNAGLNIIPSSRSMI